MNLSPFLCRWSKVCTGVLAGFWLLAAGSLRGASGDVLMITSNPDLEDGQKGFAGFLRRQGYNVTVTPPGDVTYFTLDTDASDVRAARIAQLESRDLVIIHRNFGSGTLASTEAEIAIWNRLRVPLLLCNAPIVRNNRWRWMNANSGGITTSSPNLILDQPTHPIVAGLGADLFKANRVYGGMIQGNDGGLYATLIGRASIAGFDPICLVAWDEANGEERSFYTGSGQTYFRRRVFFELHEYRNNPDAAVNDAWNELTENGQRLFANAVEFTIAGTVVSKVPPQIADLVPADGSTSWSAFDPIRFGVSSGEPLQNGNIRLLLNGVDVSAQLQFAGTPTERQVSCASLSLNRVYHAVVTASNSFGSRRAETRFDTFDPVQTIPMSTSDGSSFAGDVPEGVYRVNLRVASTLALTLALRSQALPDAPIVGVFRVPATANPAASVLVPLQDAFGTEMMLRRSGPQAFLLTGGGLETAASELILVPADDAPAVLLPAATRTEPDPTAAGVSPLTAIGLELAFRDTPTEISNIRLLVNGADVTSAASIDSTGEGARLSYVPSAFLAPGSSNHVLVILASSVPPGGSWNADYSFTVRSLPAIPAAFATALDSGSDEGFNIRNHMAPGTAGVNFTNSTARAELQLAGLLIGPGGTPVINQINDTPLAEALVESGTINYGQTEAGSSGRFPTDAVFPGAGSLPGNNIALEVTAYVALQAGINRFGVRSDDGFRLTAGESFSRHDVVLSGYEGPRGDQVPTEFDVLVYRNGLYALRLVYFDGGGGASLEWYGIYENGASPDGVDGRVLINGPDSSLSPRARAYRTRTADAIVPSPELSIGTDGSQAVLSWTAQANFQLEASADLRSADWTALSQTPDVNGDQRSLRVPLAGGSRFFRLIRR